MGSKECQAFGGSTPLCSLMVLLLFFKHSYGQKLTLPIVLK